MYALTTINDGRHIITRQIDKRTWAWVFTFQADDEAGALETYARLKK